MYTVAAESFVQYSHTQPWTGFLTSTVLRGEEEISSNDLNAQKLQ